RLGRVARQLADRRRIARSRHLDLFVVILEEAGPGRGLLADRGALDLRRDHDAARPPDRARLPGRGWRCGEIVEVDVVLDLDALELGVDLDGAGALADLEHLR